MKKRTLNIVHLYPKEMNIYGDNGNTLILRERAKLHGVEPIVHNVSVGDKLPVDTDVIISGGGQDKGQLMIEDDLQSKLRTLKQMADDGVTMLVICGTYQLFGHKFVPHNQKPILGIGIFDMETIAGDQRMIGNIVIHTHYGEVVGYENHSGQTMLFEGQKAFGKVLKGAGNNSSDKTEGAIYNNVIGSYLHGPILPKNPKLADELIRRSLVRKYGDAMLRNLDDEYAEKAAIIAKKRPR